MDERRERWLRWADSMSNALEELNADLAVAEPWLTAARRLFQESPPPDIIDVESRELTDG